MNIADRADEVRRRIESAGGDPERVAIVAVTKGFGVEAVDAATSAGIVDVGENYGRELLDKAAAAAPGARWHFLGAVQRNKIAKLAPVVSTWQAVDRLAVGEELARRAPGTRVFVQVNVSGEARRNGCGWEDAGRLVEGLRALDLDVAGLMCVASAGGGPRVRREFERLARLREALGLRELSMGMTDDLELAVEAGTTMVRIGRGLFGPR